MSKVLTAGVSHVGLTVSTLSKTVSFLEALGFKKAGGVDDYPSVFLSDGSTLITVWQAKSSRPVEFDRTSNVGLHHLAIKVSSLEALNNVYEIVKAIDGVRIEFGPQPIVGTPLTHFMCYEPCGVRIEFTHHAQWFDHDTEEYTLFEALDASWNTSLSYKHISSRRELTRRSKTIYICSEITKTSADANFDARWLSLFYEGSTTLQTSGDRLVFYSPRLLNKDNTRKAYPFFCDDLPDLSKKLYIKFRGILIPNAWDLK